MHTLSKPNDCKLATIKCIALQLMMHQINELELEVHRSNQNCNTDLSEQLKKQQKYTSYALVCHVAK